VRGLIYGILMIGPALCPGVVCAEESPTVFPIDTRHRVAIIVVGAFVPGLFL